jgi:hypothetical protein
MELRASIQNKSVRSGYAYPTVRVYHREALSCSLGGKEPFSGTGTDERASRREIESVHRKSGHNHWGRVPNGCHAQSRHADESHTEKRALLPENESMIVGYAYPIAAGYAL